MTRLLATLSAHKARSISVAAVILAILALVGALLIPGSSKAGSGDHPATVGSSGSTSPPTSGNCCATSTSPARKKGTTSTSSTTSTTRGSSAAGCSQGTGSHAVQLGIDLWWDKRNQKASFRWEEHQAGVIIDYIASDLHANAVSIGFPIYTSSKTSTSVFTTDQTPSTSELEMLVNKAKSAGLHVNLRPLLEVGTSSYVWRGTIHPSNLPAFFLSYFNALRPFLQMAQNDGVPTFDYASEFISLTESSSYAKDWATLISDMSGVYHGQLIYAESTAQYNGQPDVVPDLTEYGVHSDAYFGDPSGTPSTSEQTLYDAWAPHFCARSASELSGTVLQEVGTDAQPVGYKSPSTVAGPPTDLQYLNMQKVWFSMVCEIVHHFDLAGVYFWNVAFTLDPNTGGNSTGLGPTVWTDRPGATAIASCFAGFSH